MFENDKQKVQGDANLVAGRDINLTNSKSFSEELYKRLSSIDKRINDNVTAKIYCPTRNKSLEAFSSEKMLLSLYGLGMPIDAGLTVCERVEEQILNVVEDVDQVTTAHIRKAVSLAIFNLDPCDYGSNSVEEWGDRYARRYGNTLERIKVLHKDGSEDYLDYRFLKETVIPHLITRLLGTPFDKVCGKVIRAQNIGNRLAPLSMPTPFSGNSTRGCG